MGRKSASDPDLLGDGFERRLRAELDHVRPLFSTPRYASASRHRVGAWRLAPGALVAGVIALFGLSAYAATGNANPVVWTEQIMTRIEPTAAPESKPAAAPSEAPEPTERADPSDRPEPSQPPEPAESTEPARGQQSGSPEQSGERSPSPGER